MNIQLQWQIGDGRARARPPRALGGPRTWMCGGAGRLSDWLFGGSLPRTLHQSLPEVVRKPWKTAAYTTEPTHQSCWKSQQDSCFSITVAILWVQVLSRTPLITLPAIIDCHLTNQQSLASWKPAVFQTHHPFTHTPHPLSKDVSSPLGVAEAYKRRSQAILDLQFQTSSKTFVPVSHPV
jgi:hypothetical protein